MEAYKTIELYGRIHDLVCTDVRLLGTSCRRQDDRGYSLRLHTWRTSLNIVSNSLSSIEIIPPLEIGQPRLSNASGRIQYQQHWLLARAVTDIVQKMAPAVVPLRSRWVRRCSVFRGDDWTLIIYVSVARPVVYTAGLYRCRHLCTSPCPACNATRGHHWTVP